MKDNRQKLTALIPAGIAGDEKIIARCIKSVAWADEVFVVLDSKSRDNTEKIAKEMGARVLRHEYVYSAKQKNWAIPRAKNDWVLLVDSDEVVTPELKKEILSLLKSEEINHYDGFGIARREYFLDKWLRWGGRYPLYNIRLFRKSCRYEDRDVHAHIILPKEKTKNLNNDILHFSNPTLDHFFEKFNRYTTYQSNYMLKFSQREKESMEFKKIFTHYIYLKSLIKDYWYFLPFVPVLRFVYMYILRLGFLDGRMGFLYAMLYTFQDYVAKTKYLQLAGRKPRFRFLVQSMVKTMIPQDRNNRPIIDRVDPGEVGKS